MDQETLRSFVLYITASFYLPNSVTKISDFSQHLLPLHSAVSITCIIFNPIIVQNIDFICLSKHQHKLYLQLQKINSFDDTA